MPKIEEILKTAFDEFDEKFLNGNSATVISDDPLFKYDVENLKKFYAQKITQLLEEKEENLPMGVSQWKAHGEKYGYDKFFENQARTQLLSTLREKLPKEKDPLTYYKENNMWFDENTVAGYNQALQDVLNIIKEIEHE